MAGGSDTTDTSINQDFSGGDAGGLFGTGISTGQGISGLGGLAGAAGSLFGAIGTAGANNAQATGYQQEAALYTQAADTSLSDIPIAQANGQIETAQTQRSIDMAKGTAAAVEGFGNVGPGGSNVDILHETQAQGALALGKVGLNTQLQVNSYTQQAQAYQAQAAGATAAAQAAKSAASGGILGGIMGALGQVAQIAGPMLLAA